MQHGPAVVHMHEMMSFQFICSFAPEREDFPAVGVTLHHLLLGQQPQQRFWWRAPAGGQAPLHSFPLQTQPDFSWQRASPGAHRGASWVRGKIVRYLLLQRRLKAARGEGSWGLARVLLEHQRRRERPSSCSSCSCCRAQGRRGGWGGAHTPDEVPSSLHCPRAPERSLKGWKREWVLDQRWLSLSPYGVEQKAVFSYRHPNFNSANGYSSVTRLMGIWLLLISPPLEQQRAGFLPPLQTTTCRLQSSLWLRKIQRIILSLTRKSGHRSRLSSSVWSFLNAEFRESCSSNYRYCYNTDSIMPFPAVAWF